MVSLSGIKLIGRNRNSAGNKGVSVVGRRLVPGAIDSLSVATSIAVPKNWCVFIERALDHHHDLAEVPVGFHVFGGWCDQSEGELATFPPAHSHQGS
jgi:hypothetical protein